MNIRGQIDSDQLRTLVKAYYDGDTDTAQEELLRRTFVSVNPDTLPEDLRDEVPFFRALNKAAAIGQSHLATSITEDIKNRFSNHIDILSRTDRVDDGVTGRRRHNAISRWIIRCSAAAAIAAVMALSYMMYTHVAPATQLTVPPEATAENSTGPAEDVMPSATAADKTGTEYTHVAAEKAMSKIESERQARRHFTRTANRVDAPVAAASKSDDKPKHPNVRVCTDPYEAQRLTDKVSRIIERNVDKAKISQERVAEQITIITADCDGK